MFIDDLQSGQNVLLLWNASSNPEKLKATVEQLQTKLGSGNVQVEHAERLALCKYIMKKFMLSDKILNFLFIISYQILSGSV